MSIKMFMICSVRRQALSVTTEERLREIDLLTPPLGRTGDPGHGIRRLRRRNGRPTRCAPSWRLIDRSSLASAAKSQWHARFLMSFSNRRPLAGSCSGHRWLEG